jgi:hypothetical protein
MFHGKLNLQPKTLHYKKTVFYNALFKIIKWTSRDDGRGAYRNIVESSLIL